MQHLERQISKKIDKLTAKMIDAKFSIEEAQTPNEELIAKINYEKYKFALNEFEGIKQRKL